MDQTRPRDIAMSELEEAEFVRAAQRGDRVAFLALARWHWPWVVPVVEALCPPKRAAGRTIEVFEHAWRGLHFIPEGQRFFVWIHRIAFNLCLAASEDAEVPRGAALAKGLRSETEGDPSSRLLGALSGLSADHRQVLILRHGLRLEIEDIGRVLEVPSGIAMRRLSEARAQLYARHAGEGATMIFRHFTLAQLCDYVGTDSMTAPEFVRSHLAECADCRSILTALESQDRLLSKRFGGEADLAGIEPFLDAIVERIGDGPIVEREPVPVRSAPAPVRPTPDEASDDPAKAEAAPVPAAPSSVRVAASARSAGLSKYGPVVGGVGVVVVALLAVQYGPSARPWLKAIGIELGGPAREAPSTRVATARPPAPTEPVEGGEQAPVLRRGDVRATTPTATSLAAPARTTGSRSTRGSSGTGPTAAGKGPAAQPRAAAPTRPVGTSRADVPRDRSKASTGLLCGQVKDRQGRPVADARLTVTGFQLVTPTDRWGRFCFSIPAGEQTLSVTSAGFNPLRKLVSVGPTTAELTLVLDSLPPHPTPPVRRAGAP